MTVTSVDEEDEIIDEDEEEPEDDDYFLDYDEEDSEFYYDEEPPYYDDYMDDYYYDDDAFGETTSYEYISLALLFSSIFLGVSLLIFASYMKTSGEQKYTEKVHLSYVVTLMVLFLALIFIIADNSAIFSELPYSILLISFLIFDVYDIITPLPILPSTRKTSSFRWEWNHLSWINSRTSSSTR